MAFGVGMSGERSFAAALGVSRASREGISSRSRLSVVGPDGANLGADALALPTEEALLVRISLPLSSQRQRRAAVGYAVEDLIAEPLEASHVVLGPELAPGEFLAFVVSHGAMQPRAARAKKLRARLVPDVLALPVPAQGSVAVHEALGRVLVRRPDGTGFATPIENFAALWRADGAPQIVLYGGRLPDGIPVGASGLIPSAPTPEALAVDLLEGPYIRDNRGRRRLFGGIAAMVALAVGAYAASFAADTYALTRIATEREAALRAELAIRVPGVGPDTPLDLALRRAMPAAEQPGLFLPLLARVSEALQPVGGTISLRTLAFDASDGSLALTIEAPDLETLQTAESHLTAAGLAVASGVATTSDAGAEVRTVIGANS